MIALVLEEQSGVLGQATSILRYVVTSGNAKSNRGNEMSLLIMRKPIEESRVIHFLTNTSLFLDIRASLQYI